MSETTEKHQSLPEASQGSTFLTANRVKILLGAVVLVGALVYFGFMALRSATVYYYTVGELNAQRPSEEGRIVRVSGKLVPDSFDRPEGSISAFFQLTDGTHTLRAAHQGVLPDLFFNEHSEIILEGHYTPGGVFESENVIVKCPSKYIAKAEAESG
ncbi:MAG: cytochrome c maturation protein CcmE [SAR202 cluster bacterium]|nr:cytochrome c maturation protein CcmE [SAR202 cluster bacterium]